MRAVLVVWASVLCVLASGCGLTLDYGPPDVDAGRTGTDAGMDGGAHSRCFGRPDGTDCAVGTAARRICISQRCVPSSCGDGYVDTAGGEQCEPDLDPTCGTTCRYECATSSDCVASTTCLSGTCIDHRCNYDPNGGAVTCALATGESGLCNQGLCVPLGCGNSVVETNEDCDPGSAAAPGCHGCHFDCTSDADCDDGDGCDGHESCSAIDAGGIVIGRACTNGSPTMCGDPTGCFTIACVSDPGGAPACVPMLVDADHDGYAPLDHCDMGAPGGDCDDTDPTVHPGAPEICNGVDDDCNGMIDDHTMQVTWCFDADGDGYGDPNVTMLDCGRPGPGFVRDCTDCYDSGDATSMAEAALVHPGQARFFGTPYCPSGSVMCTYDYDCDGHDVPQWNRTVMCGLLAPLLCATSAGWQGTVPACGASGTFTTCHPTALLLCQSNSMPQVQTCH